jgi:hypothetical protein
MTPEERAARASRARVGARTSSHAQRGVAPLKRNRDGAPNSGTQQK